MHLLAGRRPRAERAPGRGARAVRARRRLGHEPGEGRQARPRRRIHERGRAGRARWSGGGRIVAALALAGGGFAGGAAAERSGALPGAIAREPAGVESTFSVFWQAWELVQQHYVERQTVEPTQMTYGAVEGMLDALGDSGHTRFLSPKELRDFRESLAGRLEGIGAEVGMRNGRPTSRSSR